MAYWHHGYSTSAGGKDLSNDTQIRVIGPGEPEICTKMLKKLSEKLRPKLHYTWLLHGKNCPSLWRFLRSFLNASKPSRRSITSAKRKEKEKKERRKTIPKIEKPKDKGHFLNKKFQNFYFCAGPCQNVLKRINPIKNTLLNRIAPISVLPQSTLPEDNVFIQSYFNLSMTASVAHLVWSSGWG